MNEKDIDLIENFLAGKLSAEARKEVEGRLLTDQEFAQRVEIFKALPSLASHESHDFRNELESIYQEYHQPALTSKILARRTLFMAASLALLISVIGILIWILPGTLTPQKLYATHFTVPADNVTVRSNQEISPTLLSAMEAYNAEEYTFAISQFESILGNDPTSLPALFYSGISYLLSGDNEKAVQNLQKVASTTDPAYALSARWYLGLAYLKQNNLEQAREVFSSLKESGSSYAKKADTILQQLEVR